ncbi:hypothetical protein FB565_001653 [Actinoplanes lutulentus]|uniref:hypothetical protein n=1 Tax=Actinoplanes lutulentus TaxID=1287878 RepID=UPI0011B94C71|nr:hypothetical protein [Actinoplanes lutulentus]MBB2941949.1 hypothetical protein [Actinoplanes lutulentus]
MANCQVMRCPRAGETIFATDGATAMRREFWVCQQHLAAIEGGAAWCIENLGSDGSAILIGDDVIAGDLLFHGFRMSWETSPSSTATPRRVLSLIAKSAGGSEESLTFVISDEQLRELAKDLTWHLQGGGEKG